MPRSHPEYERGFTDGFNSKQRDVDEAPAEVGRLREALEPLVTRIEKMMANGPECDCPPEGHMCGWPSLRREVKAARAVLSPKKAGE
jgi:hypothetical protein